MATLTIQSAAPVLLSVDVPVYSDPYLIEPRVFQPVQVSDRVTVHVAVGTHEVVLRDAQARVLYRARLAFPPDQVVDLTDPVEGALTAVVRDDQGRILSFCDGGIVTEVTRDDAGYVRTITVAGGLVRTVVRDDQGRIVSVL